MTRISFLSTAVVAAVLAVSAVSAGPVWADGSVPSVVTTGGASAGVPQAKSPVVEQVGRAQFKDVLRQSKSMVLTFAIDPDCADCKDLPALLKRQATMHPGVQIVTVSGAEFQLPADKLPIVGMFEPGVRFMFDFSPIMPAYVEANVKLTAKNIGAWMTERLSVARAELADMRRYNYLMHASMKLEDRALKMYDLGDSWPVRLRRARMHEAAADCLAEMGALQKRITVRMEQDRKWRPTPATPAAKGPAK